MRSLPFSLLLLTAAAVNCGSIMGEFASLQMWTVTPIIFKELVRILYTYHCAHFSKCKVLLSLWHLRTTKKKILIIPVVCIGVRHSLILREGHKTGR
jgi:hypothetical protein